MAEHQHFGRLGEKCACERLVADGYELVETNYSCKNGEIDIIAREGGDLVFVEVRTRRSASYGAPSGTVGAAKWKRIKKAAQHFQRSRRAGTMAIRFDIVSIVWPQDAEPQVDVLKGVVPGGKYL